MDVDDLIPPSFSLTTKQPLIDYPKIHQIPSVSLVLFEVPKNFDPKLLQGKHFKTSQSQKIGGYDITQLDPITTQQYQAIMPLAGGKVRMGKPFVQAYKIKEHKELPVLEEDAVIKDKYYIRKNLRKLKAKAKM